MLNEPVVFEGTDPAQPTFFVGRMECGCICAVTRRESEVRFFANFGLLADEVEEEDAKREWGYLKGSHLTWECKNPNRVLYGDPRCVADRRPIFVPERGVRHD